LPGELRGEKYDSEEENSLGVLLKIRGNPEKRHSTGNREL
jgi:hypothetical protein